MRICLVRLSALGDIVMCLPLVRTLQKSFPEAEITWIVGKPFYPLLEKLEGVHLIAMPKVKSWKGLKQAKAILKPYAFDVLLATQASLSAHLLYPFISAKRKIGYDSFRSKDFHSLFVQERIAFCKEHTVEGFLRFAKTMGANKISFDGTISLEEGVALVKEPYFVINPCSSKKEKDWDYSNYRHVIQYVRDNFGMRAVLTGGESDAAVCDQIAKESHAINLCGKTSLQELARLIKGSKFLISPDTGPLHIASALGTPVIGLYATTSSLLTGPYFSKEHVIDKHEEALKLYATQKQRQLGWNVRIYHKDAMKLITIVEVQEKISRLFSSTCES